MEGLHFSGHHSGHGDQVMLNFLDDKTVSVDCSNDGYPCKAAGGYSMLMPEELIQNYNQDAFIKWLKQNFWNGVEIDVLPLVKESEVRNFLGKARKPHK